MKSKFLAVIVAVIVAMSAAFVVACEGGDPPPQLPPPDPDPIYVDLTLDEFGTHADQIFAIENYLEVLGYKFDFNVNAQVDAVTADFVGSAILDASRLDDVCISVNLNSVITEPPQESGSEGQAVTYTPSVTETEINLYLYSKTLYMDITSGDETIKDSLEGVENDLTEIMMMFIAAPVEEDIELAPTIPEIDGDAVAEIEALMEYFTDFLTVRYCKELGHYVIELNYEQGGVYEGEHIDPFAVTVELYVKNGRMTGMEYDFVSAELRYSGALAEHNGSIVYPENPSEYNSVLFEMIEELLYGEMAS